MADSETLLEPLRERVLITGASGFVGGNLRRALLAAGADVLAIRRPTSPPVKEGRGVVASYDDVEGLTRIFAEEKPTYVFHVAGATNGITYDDFQRANVMPTRNLLEAIQASGIALKRFLYVSSLTSLGPSTLARPHGEDALPRPIEHYGRSKLEAEQLLESIGDAVPWTILRPGGVYGPGDAEFGILFQEAARGRTPFYGNRKKGFSIVYVDDLVRAIVDAARSDATIGQAYNISDGTPMDWETFQMAIAEGAGRRVRAIDLPPFLLHVAGAAGEVVGRITGKPSLANLQKTTMGVQEAWTCTCDKAQRDFGFAPRVLLAEGVARSWDWYRREGWV
jgi:nucleoside-diphosphate-sugar epimerase